MLSRHEYEVFKGRRVTDKEYDEYTQGRIKPKETSMAKELKKTGGKLPVIQPPYQKVAASPASVMGLSSSARKMWFDVYDQEEVDAKFADNYKRIKDAEKEAENMDRPYRVLLISSSGRTKDSCAHEESRSTSVIKELIPKFKDRDVTAVHYDLWDLNIEHCNGCYGTEDYWCHWPCTCWPFDDGQKLYEEIIKCDAIVIGTPVNEASPASRFHQWWHRNICVDGGKDFKPPEGWTKSTEELERMRHEHGGHAEGIPFIQRFNGKPVGIIVLGHEAGTQLAASQIAASVQYRGAYVPAHAMIAMTYVGSGPNSQDREVVKGEVYPTFREELDKSITAMLDSLMRDIELNRLKEPAVYKSDRT